MTQLILELYNYSIFIVFSLKLELWQMYSNINVALFITW